VAHAVPVLVTVIFTTYLCNAFRNSVLDLKDAQKDVAARNAELEKLKQGLEVKVQNRTTDLSDKLVEMEKLNRRVAESELKMLELKKDMEAMKKGTGPMGGMGTPN
jgi:peptidoglycan hydrolase CwlO-like protein